MSNESAKKDLIHEILSPPRDEEPKRSQLDEQAGDQSLQTPMATAEANVGKMDSMDKANLSASDSSSDSWPWVYPSSDDEMPIQTTGRRVKLSSLERRNSDVYTSDERESSNDKKPIQAGGAAENGAVTKPQMDAGAPEDVKKMNEDPVPALKPTPEILNTQPIIGEVKSLGPDAAAVAILDTPGKEKKLKEKTDVDTEPLEGVGVSQAPDKE